MGNSDPFRFKKFQVRQENVAMKVGTDGVLLGAWANIEAANSILDIGTGTGLIALILAQRTETSIIHGVEIDADAFDQAVLNINESPWTDRMKLYHESIQEFGTNHLNQFDLIVSNPPFFTGGTLSGQVGRDAVRHTTKLSHADLLQAVNKLLKASGKMAVILPLIEGLRFIEIAEGFHLFVSRITEVQSKINKPVERLLIEFTKTKNQVIKNSLIIQTETDTFTQEYIYLTHDYYLLMP